MVLNIHDSKLLDVLHPYTNTTTTSNLHFKYPFVFREMYSIAHISNNVTTHHACPVQIQSPYTNWSHHHLCNSHTTKWISSVTSNAYRRIKLNPHSNPNKIFIVLSTENARYPIFKALHVGIPIRWHQSPQKRTWLVTRPQLGVLHSLIWD